MVLHFYCLIIGIQVNVYSDVGKTNSRFQLNFFLIQSTNSKIDEFYELF
jgi:hypothetical protein